MSQLPESRTRSFTEKGQMYYDELQENMQQKVDRFKNGVEVYLDELDNFPTTKTPLISAEQKLKTLFDRYETESDHYLEFLSRNVTENTRVELDSVYSTFHGVKKRVTLMLDKMSVTLSQIAENNSLKSERTGNSLHSSRKSLRSNRSHHSSNTNSSQLSNVSSLVARVKAKAEAAKAKLHIALEEASLKKERNKINIELDLLAQKKEVAAPEAEASCLEKELNSNYGSELPDESENPVERTKRYVMNVGKEVSRDVINDTNVKALSPHATPFSIPHYSQAAPLQIDPQPVIMSSHNPKISPLQVDTQPVFMPSHNSTNDPPYDIVKYLLKKDLFFAKFRHFDDKPGHFIVWKAEFKNMIRDLQCTPLEEIGLLTSWLGPESSKHAISIRSSYAHDPVLGLQNIWSRLDERYGSAEFIESALKAKLAAIPKLTNSKQLYELHDILTEINSVKQQPQYKDLFAYYDSSLGIKPIIQKLSTSLQEKWVTHASRYKKQNAVLFPSFSEFVKFIGDASRIKNDPSFNFDSTVNNKRKEIDTKPRRVVTTKTMVTSAPLAEHHHSCIIHKNVRHTLNECRAFRAKPLQERKALLKEHKICYRCCDSSGHIKRKCQTSVECKICGSTYHCSALHEDIEMRNKPIDKFTSDTKGRSSSDKYGGEISDHSTLREIPNVQTNCTEICGIGFKGKSCARILPVFVYPKGSREQAIRVYAMLDDQSNKSLGRKELFDQFNVYSEHMEYLLTSCSGRVSVYGRRVRGLVIESEDGRTRLDLPTIIKCDEIPDNQSEIPTPDVTEFYEHLRDISECIAPYDDSCKVLLLIGRDLPEVHHVLDQRLGPPRAPFAQKSPLGWTIIGDVCLSGQHVPNITSVCKTFVTSNGRSSILEPCSQTVKIQDYVPAVLKDVDIGRKKYDFHSSDLFERTTIDNKVGTSVEDRLFLNIMDHEMYMGPGGKWVAPLPFRSPRVPLPNNFNQAMHRAKSLDSSLSKDPVKKEHFLSFMQKLIDNNHAEIAPPLHRGDECWYLPLFGVYHPKKPHQIRGVFDSSAKCEGVSLNDILLSGPDLTNSLLGVLIRFRKEMVAVVADIQQMFYCFEVREDHRNYLRFLWHRDNKIENEVVTYRMKVHVFGNSPSPSVATYGLLKSALTAEKHYGPEVKQFVGNNFYVDNGLLSVPSSTEAIDIIKKTQDALSKIGQLRLHKIASNDILVMQAFEPDDLSKDLIDLDLDEGKPLHRSLGLNWNLNTDMFEFNVSTDLKPVSRRGNLSVVNSVYDPLGFLSPFTILGKLILRKVTSSTSDWDEPLPEHLVNEWEDWHSSLAGVKHVLVPRAFVPNLSKARRKELWTYSDASEQAIAAVSYLRVTYEDGSSKTGFVLGKAKVAPLSGHTIPRLELCGAVLAVEVAQLALDQLQIEFDAVKYFTDSRVVLGYVCNEKKRFLIYVANRVERIRHSSKPSQWNYVSTHDNPADVLTRGLRASEIQNSTWLIGPKKPLLEGTHDKSVESDSPDVIYPLINPDQDKEVRCTTLKTNVDVSSHLGTHRFERFSKLSALVNAISLLQRYVRFRYHKGSGDIFKATVSSFQDSEKFIIKCVQQEIYEEELACLSESKSLPRNSSIISLDPILDNNGILCVGGRLKRTNSDSLFKNPIIIPGKHYVATLLVRMCHEKVNHQGRHFTEGKIRSSGFWITGCKRLVSSILRRCVICRKLRRDLETPKMADLPEDRITPGQPPFTSVGVDIFGLWKIVTRRTRGGSANNKRWAALFTCLVTRAVHIEVVEEMSSSSFINALRRFVAVRGKVREFRSDRGTNFIGALDPLQINSIKVEDAPVKDFLYDSGTVWIFNHPHSSHMGGVWERMIGVTRRILDSLLLENSKTLTHEVLTTFLAEVSSIINSRPLVSVSTDPEAPFILTPAILLTQKTDAMDNDVTLSDMDPKDLLRKQWKRVQHLATIFWKRWKHEYLQTLQFRRK